MQRSPVAVLAEVARMATYGATFRQRMSAIATSIERNIPWTNFGSAVFRPGDPSSISPDLAFHTADFGTVKEYAERFQGADPMLPTFVIG